MVILPIAPTGTREATGNPGRNLKPATDTVEWWKKFNTTIPPRRNDGRKERKMKRIYIAVTIKQDRNERTFSERTNPNYDPGYCAFVVSCTDQDNLKSVLDRIGGLQHANIFPTKKAAE